MEELELLKNDWNKTGEFKDYSEKEICGMIRQKSVSVTKTLLIIVGVEIVLWSVIGYIDAAFPVMRMVLFFVFLIPVIMLFRNIKTGGNSLSLMKNILNLRKIVFGYAFISFFMIVSDNIIHYDLYTKDLISGWNNGRAERSPDFIPSRPETLIPSAGNYIAFGVVLIIVVYILFLIYKSTYGKILADLKKNYGELSRPEENRFE